MNSPKSLKDVQCMEIFRKLVTNWRIPGILKIGLKFPQDNFRKNISRLENWCQLKISSVIKI